MLIAHEVRNSDTTARWQCKAVQLRHLPDIRVANQALYSETSLCSLVPVAAIQQQKIGWQFPFTCIPHVSSDSPIPCIGVYTSTVKMVFNATRTARIVAVALLLIGTLSARLDNTTTMNTSSLACRYLPGDVEWPTDEDWSALNLTTGGRLIRGVPLAEACYRPSLDEAQCATIRDNWIQMTP